MRLRLPGLFYTDYTSLLWWFYLYIYYLYLYSAFSKKSYKKWELLSALLFVCQIIAWFG